MLHSISLLMERSAALLQGKGYGSASIAREISLASRLLHGSGYSPKLAVDIGGNVGKYSAELRRRYPEMEIHIFEPAATNIGILTAKFGEDERVRIMPAAVSGETGTATLFSDSPGSGLGSLTQRRLDHFQIDFNTKESVSTIRFEDYWEKALGHRVIDLAKLDIEGHEMDALKGFGDALRRTRVVQFEFGGCNIDTRTYFQDFWYFFSGLGFSIYRITPIGVQTLKRYRENDEYFKTTNYLALNGSLQG
jgi:FkbM family methyltransferase